MPGPFLGIYSNYKDLYTMGKNKRKVPIGFSDIEASVKIYMFFNFKGSYPLLKYSSQMENKQEIIYHKTVVHIDLSFQIFNILFFQIFNILNVTHFSLLIKKFGFLKKFWVLFLSMDF